MTPECEGVSGSLYGMDASFHVGRFDFSGTTDGRYLETTFRSDDGEASGRAPPLRLCATSRA